MVTDPVSDRFPVSDGVTEPLELVAVSVGVNVVDAESELVTLRDAVRVAEEDRVRDNDTAWVVEREAVAETSLDDDADTDFVAEACSVAELDGENVVVGVGGGVIVAVAVID